MSDAKQRVIEELKDLGEKSSKLIKFTCDEHFATLSGEMQHQMINQLHIMIDYANCLRRRLEIWDKTDAELSNNNRIM